MKKLQLCKLILALMIVLLAANAALCYENLQDFCLTMPNPAEDSNAFKLWQIRARESIMRMVGIPETKIPLNPIQRGFVETDEIIIEKWIVSLEPGSKAPALVYRPKNAPSDKLPAIVLTFGHGGSKSAPYYQYAGQVLAKMNFICFALEPMGEEERHKDLGMGTRKHDEPEVDKAAWDVGRPVLGKMLFDTMRGIDYLLTREDVDPERIGVVGNSLGGKVALWMTALDPRLHCGIVSGSGSSFSPRSKYRGKPCTKTPAIRMLEKFSWHEFLCLAVPHCSVVIANGDADSIADKDGSGSVWRYTDESVSKVQPIFATMGNPKGVKTWYKKGGGHRPYFINPDQLAWLCEKLEPPKWTSQRVDNLSQINYGKWADKNNVPLEEFYATDLHQRGLTTVDLNVKYFKPEQLRVLNDLETGSAVFTVEGWLDYLQTRDKHEQ